MLKLLPKKFQDFLAILHKQEYFIYFLFIYLREVEKIHLILVDGTIYCGIIILSRVGHIVSL